MEPERTVIVLQQVLEWFADPVNWSGADGVPQRLLQHVTYSVIATLLAAAIALPVGLWLGHTGRGGQLAINISNVGRAVPTFGAVLLIGVLAPLNPVAIVLALVVLAIPPILTNTYVGIRAVDPEIRDAGEGMGLRGGQVLAQVEVPVAMPLIMTGIRTSAVQVVATATIAAIVGLGGLGRYIIDGFGQRRTGEIVAGALLVAALALLTEIGLGRLQDVVVPAGLRGRAAAEPGAARSR